MGALDDPLNLAGALFLLRFNWVWMLVALALGASVGWRTAGEAQSTPPEEQA